MHKKTIPTTVLGGSGYVASEIIGLLLNHSAFRLDAVVSSTHAGSRIDAVFPHLTGAAGDLEFSSLDEARPWLDGKRQVAVFSALPHGATASALDGLLKSAEAARVVDVSADFRFRNPDQYAEVYGKPHEAPELLKQFTCALPDLTPETPDPYISHPGCFATGITLALAPLFHAGLIEPTVQVSSVTGSTGAGRQPGTGTHHPHRQSSMWAYQPLVHRHRPEIEMLVAGYEPKVDVQFVPHSGPFSRGIHSTIFARLKTEQSAGTIAAEIAAFYAKSPFIKVSESMPTLKEIVGTNRCHLGVVAQGNQLVVTSVLDNLVKGAAGGAVQWMNRMFALNEAEGLVHAVPGWI